MADGEGSTSYVYNGFRQLQSETRTFTTLTNKSFALSYTYNLADQPKSVTEVMNLSGGGSLMAEEERILQAASAARPGAARRKAQVANFWVFGNRRGMPQYIGVGESKSSQGAFPCPFRLSIC